jgi:hypothetical protein
MIVNSNYVSGHFIGLIMDINLNNSIRSLGLAKSSIISITNYTG